MTGLIVGSAEEGLCQTLRHRLNPPAHLQVQVWVHTAIRMFLYSYTGCDAVLYHVLFACFVKGTYLTDRLLSQLSLILSSGNVIQVNTQFFVSETYCCHFYEFY